MPLWNMTDVNTGAPKNMTVSGLGSAQNSQIAYQNVTVGAVKSNIAIGLFGVDVNEAANATFEGANVTHAGWVQRIVGTGYVQSIIVTNGGTGLTPGPGYITFVGGGAGSGANAAYQVNAAGSVANVTLNVSSYAQGGGGNYNVAPTANTAVAYTIKPVFEITMGGRTGRKQYITLVAAGSMSRDANTDDAIVGG